MDTIGIEIPEAPKRFDRRRAAGALAATAAACLAGGYVLGTSSDGGSGTQTIIARGTPATWEDAVRESLALKRHAAEAPRGTAIDIRMARVER
jgi:hypothetical protein